MVEDLRNVQDRFKGWANDLIREAVSSITYDFAVLMENFVGDFNVGSVVRSANALGAKETFYLGRKHWDRRGAQGCHNYSVIKHLPSMLELLPLKEKYTFIAFENNIKDVKSLKEFVWPKEKPPLMIFGEEGCGITKETLELAETIVEIPLRGSIRSLNAACASSIAMWDYIAKI